MPRCARCLREQMSAGLLGGIWPVDVLLGEHQFVEVQHALHLSDRIIEIVERITVIDGTTDAARRMSELSVQLGEGVALYVDPWIGAASRARSRRRFRHGQGHGPLSGHPVMLALQYLDGPLGIRICREPLDPVPFREHGIAPMDRPAQELMGRDGSASSVAFGSGWPSTRRRRCVRRPLCGKSPQHAVPLRSAAP